MISTRISTGFPKIYSKGEYQLGSPEHPAAVLGSGVENALEIEADRSLTPMTVYLFRSGNINPADPESAVHSEATLVFRYIQDPGGF